MTSPLHLHFFRILWILNTMPKWKVLIWNLWHNSLTTSENLFRRGLGDSASCLICLIELESRQHLFQECPLSLEAWSTNTNLLIPHIDNASSSFETWLLEHIL